MSRFGFCGPSYQSILPNADAEWCMNLYPEIIESPNGRSAMSLLQIDGLGGVGARFNGSPTNVLGSYTFAGRTFVVWIDGTGPGTGSLVLTEVFYDGSVNDLYSVANISNTTPASFAANPTQLIWTAANTGEVYVLTLSNNTTTVVTLSAGNASIVDYLDGFFVALIAGTNTFMVSDLEDGTTWPSINTATISEFPDPAVGMIVTQRTLGFLGQKASVPYYNSGALFPFIPIPGAYIEEGAIATYAVTKLDNTVLWLGGNVDQGTGVAYRLNGYTPQRISNHAIERIWQTYPTLTDAIACAWQANGHKFWHIYFPTANASWRYDISTQMWHQVGYFNQKTGNYDALAMTCHTYNFGKHLVGLSFTSAYTGSLVGSLAQMSPTFPAFFQGAALGTSIRPCRRSPYVAVEHERIFINQLEVLAQSGQASQIQSASSNTSILNIADSNGVLWSVTISDNGTITVANAAAGQVASDPVILADNVNQSTYWQLQVSTGGVLSGAALNLPPAPAIFPMASIPTLPNTLPLDTGLEVNQAGVVSSVTPLPHYRAPQLDLRVSNDGANSWSNSYSASLGLTGEYTKRTIWRRLGVTRNMVFEVSCADPISLRIVDAYVNGDPSFKPTERLAAQIAKAS